MSVYWVVDLDGTLCDSRHRQHLAEAKQWDEFHSRLSLDNPYPDVGAFIQSYPISQFICLTGRPENYRMETEKWLIRHSIPINALLMRPENDFESDTVVKPRLLYSFLGGRESALKLVTGILEDRDIMVEKWREEGFHCWQVRPGGY